MDEDEKEDSTKQSDTPEKFKLSKTKKVRSNSTIRIVIILLLMAIIAALFIFWGKARIVLAGAFIALLLALGLEVSGNDWDLGKLIETRSFSESKVEKSENGNWMLGDECAKEKLNCDNFEYQEDAQELFEYCGGLNNDIHRLDGDNDGLVCEALPSKD